MSNRLAMATVQAILQLHSLRWSQRRIAEELEIDRKTVRRYLSRYVQGPKGTEAPPGRSVQKGPLHLSRIGTMRGSVLLICRPGRQPKCRRGAHGVADTAVSIA